MSSTGTVEIIETTSVSDVIEELVPKETGGDVAPARGKSSLTKFFTLHVDNTPVASDRGTWDSQSFIDEDPELTEEEIRMAEQRVDKQLKADAPKLYKWDTALVLSLIHI